MDDSEAMDRAIALASAVRTTTSPNPWVGCVVAGHRRRRLRGRHRSRPADPTPRSWRSAAAGAAAPGAPPSSPPSSRAPTTAAPPPCADALIDAGVARVVVGIEDPDPQRGRARASPACAAAGIAVEVGVRADEVAEQLARLPQPPPHRPALRRAEAGRHPRRPHRGARRLQPVDHRRPRPGPTPTGCGPRATPSLVGAGTVRADDPALTVRHVAARRRPPAAPGRARPAPPTSAKVQPAPRARRRPRRGARRARATRASLQVLVEGGATVAGAFHRGRPGRPLRRLPGAGAVRRRRRPPAVRRPRRADDRRRVAGPDRRRHAASATTSASTCSPRIGGAPDVHRHRRGARARSRAATDRSCASPPTTVLDGRDDRRLHRGQRLLPHRGRLGRRAGGRPTSPTRPSPAPTSATLAPGDPVNLERPVRLEDRLGGHLVQGHVDAVGEVVEPGARPAGAHAARAAALRRREGLDHRRRHQPHRRRRRSTTASPSPSSRTPPTVTTLGAQAARATA